MYYQFNSNSVNNFTIDLILKLVIFGGIMYASFCGHGTVAVIMTLIIGLIFV
jgi:hypothetical protein